MPRRSPHFRIDVTLARSPEGAELFADADLLAAYVRLGVAAIERMAGQNDDRFSLHVDTLRQVLGASHRRKLDERVAKLEKLCGILCQFSTNFPAKFAQNSSKICTIIWPKFAESQGLHFPPHNLRPHTSYRTHTDIHTDNKKTHTAHTDDTSIRIAPKTILWGDLTPVLDDATVAQLRDLKPGGIGFSDDEIQAWFLWAQPRMAARGLRRFQRAAVNWFPRTSRAEIRAAIDWVEAQALRRTHDVPAIEGEIDTWDEALSHRGVDDDDGGVLKRNGLGSAAGHAGSR